MWPPSPFRSTPRFANRSTNEQELLGDCASRPFFWSQKMHRSVTTNILLPHMFFRCDTKNRKSRNLTEIVFCATRRKKGNCAPRWLWVVGGFFSSDRRASIQPARAYAESALLFIQHCYIFRVFFFAFRPNAPVVFL